MNGPPWSHVSPRLINLYRRDDFVPVHQRVFCSFMKHEGTKSIVTTSLTSASRTTRCSNVSRRHHASVLTELLRHASLGDGFGSRAFGSVCCQLRLKSCSGRIRVDSFGSDSRTHFFLESPSRRYSSLVNRAHLAHRQRHVRRKRKSVSLTLDSLRNPTQKRHHLQNFRNIQNLSLYLRVRRFQAAKLELCRRARDVQDELF